MSWFLPLMLALSGSPACGPAVCSCVGPRTPTAALESAAAVFTGRVTSVADTTVDTPHGPWRQRAVRFRVDAGWKGVHADEVTVLTGMGGGDCGLPFRRGETWLVYAHGDATSLGTGICSRTAPLEHAREDLRELGPPPRAPRATATR